MDTTTVANVIETLYIKEIGQIIAATGNNESRHPFMAYMVIGAGIEFLGKVLAQPQRNNWSASGYSRTDFQNAVEQLDGLRRYKDIWEILYISLRCGLLHSSRPGNNLVLGDIGCPENIVGPKSYCLCLASFYSAFECACRNVLSREDLASVLSEPFFCTWQVSN